MLSVLFPIITYLWLFMTFVVLTLFVLQYYVDKKFETAYRVCYWLLLRVLLPLLVICFILKEIFT